MPMTYREATKQQTAAVFFTVFWLAILTVFSFGSLYANMLATYALLAFLVGVKSASLVRRDVPKAVSAALAFAGAIQFGPVGGLTVGMAAGIGTGVSGSSAYSTVRVLKTGLQAALAGAVAGLARMFIVQNTAHTAYLQVIAVVVPAVACLVALLASELFAGHQRSWSLANRRIRGYRLAGEFVAGAGIAVAADMLQAITLWQPIAVLMPLAYLINVSLLEIAADPFSRLTKRSGSIADVYLATIESIAGAIDAKEKFKSYHTKGVERVAVAIAQQMKLSPNDVEGIRTAAILHDIGRLGVPDHVLHKPGKLDDQDFEKVRAHSAIGEKVLRGVNFPWPVGAMIRSHHERWDGGGYPDGLKGNEIPVGARILAAADVFDAMTNKRSYRENSTPEQVLEYVKGAAGTHFDPAVVEAFVEGVEQYGLDHFLDSRGESPDTSGVEPSPEADESAGRVIEDGISGYTDEFLAMYEIAQTASTTLNLEEVLSLMANKIRNMVSCSTCVIYLRDDQSDRLAAKIAVGVNGRYFEDSRTLVGHGLTGMVARSGEGLVAAYDRFDLMLKQLYIQWIELQSTMIVPILSGEEVIGTLNLYDIAPDAFRPDDLRMLTVVSPQVGRAIQNAQLFEQTRESALTDPLTGLHNARYMLLHLEQELSRAKRSKSSVSVLCLDLDNFKPVNDTFGHQQGDQALRELGSLFKAQVRDYDAVCRYAGDEFVIILPGVSGKEAQETAERIKHAVDAYDPGFHHDQPVRIGVSIGLAAFPDDGDDVKSLVARADTEMYADKRRRHPERHAA